MRWRGRKWGCVVWGGTMTTACEEDLAEGRKPWAMRHRDRERATVGSPHQEVGSQRRAVCPCPSGTARRERGLCQSVYQSHRSKKPGQSVARLPHWLHAQQSSLSPHSLVWGCNMRRRRNHGAFSGGKQDYVLRNAKRVTRKYTPNTLKYLRGIETQRTIFANQMGVFRDTRWTSANAELNTHTLTCQD